MAAVLGGVTFLVAYDDGAYSPSSRGAIAVVVWWTLLVGFALGVWRLERVPRGAILPGALLASFAAWALASTAWSSSAEDAFAEFDRTALYLGAYVLAVVAGGRRQLPQWIDGLTVGIAAVGIVALISRLFPGSFPSRGLPAAIPNASARLSFPLGYWNGLGLFLAIAFPLLLHSALARGRARRAAAVGFLPALGTALYLTSSRGAVVALAGGLLVFLVAEPRRCAALGALLVGAAGTAASIGMLLDRDELVGGQLGSAAARTQGWQAAVLVAVICVAAAAAFESARGRVRPPRVPRVAAAAAILAVVAGGAFAGYATHAVRDFTRLPTPEPGGSVGVHLLSGSGSGRWQFWGSALDEFRSAPLHGGGAGSYEAWWSAHGSFSYFVKDAHSLYLETLGELGIVGFLLLAGALGTGAAAAARRLRAPDTERSAVAALLGAFAIYLIGAGTDWMWELTAVTLVAVCAFGLLTGSATVPVQRPPARVPRRLVPAAAAAVAACALVVAEAIPLLADVEVRRSQASVRAGDLGLARSHAVAATRVEPWAAAPYLQLALVDEAAGNPAAARRAVDQAIRRDREDWRAWLVAARIERRAGDGAGAARSLARAQSLNPRSALVPRR